MIPSQSDDERKRLLHFVIVGGGPTGVEFAAEVKKMNLKISQKKNSRSCSWLI